jgi:hypothetical protein
MGSDKHQMAVVDKATIMPAAIAAAPLAAPIGRQRIFSTSSQQGADHLFPSRSCSNERQWLSALLAGRILANVELACCLTAR